MMVDYIANAIAFHQSRCDANIRIPTLHIDGHAQNFSRADGWLGQGATHTVNATLNQPHGFTASVIWARTYEIDGHAQNFSQADGDLLRSVHYDIYGAAVTVSEAFGEVGIRLGVPINGFSVTYHIAIGELLHYRQYVVSATMSHPMQFDATVELHLPWMLDGWSETHSQAGAWLDLLEFVAGWSETVSIADGHFEQVMVVFGASVTVSRADGRLGLITTIDGLSVTVSRADGTVGYLLLIDGSASNESIAHGGVFIPTVIGYGRFPFGEAVGGRVGASANPGDTAMAGADRNGVETPPGKQARADTDRLVVVVD
jgi:hypothetical protein